MGSTASCAWSRAQRPRPPARVRGPRHGSMLARASGWGVLAAVHGLDGLHPFFRSSGSFSVTRDRHRVEAVLHSDVQHAGIGKDDASYGRSREAVTFDR